MKIASIIHDGQHHLVSRTDNGLAVLDVPPDQDLGRFLLAGGTLDDLHAFERAASRPRHIDEASAVFLLPIARPGKAVCIGLNYAGHTAESPYEQPDYPTLFLRAATALGAHGAAVERPLASDSLDFEGEMVVILSGWGRHIPPEQALACVFGYSVGNEISVREFQFKSPQWTMGKNFDGTGTWSPWVVTADELPPGGHGLDIQTRLNGETVQSANTRDMIHDAAEIISTVSQAMTLESGDILFSGTPAGVGVGRTPRLYMKDGDTVEVEIERIGVLRNQIIDQQASMIREGSDNATLFWLLLVVSNDKLIRYLIPVFINIAV